MASRLDKERLTKILYTLFDRAPISLMGVVWQRFSKAQEEVGSDKISKISKVLSIRPHLLRVFTYYEANCFSFNLSVKL